MTKEELQEQLKKDNVPPDAYCLAGGLPNEAYCLEDVNGEWQVYYSERGNKTGLIKFGEDEEACDYFYELVTSDGSVQKN